MRSLKRKKCGLDTFSVCAFAAPGKDVNVETTLACRPYRLCMCLVQLWAADLELLKCVTPVKGEEKTLPSSPSAFCFGCEVSQDSQSVSLSMCFLSACTYDSHIQMLQINISLGPRPLWSLVYMIYGFHNEAEQHIGWEMHFIWLSLVVEHTRPQKSCLWTTLETYKAIMYNDPGRSPAVVTVCHSCHTLCPC